MNLVVAGMVFAFAQAFYLPGVAPIDYEVNAPVELKVNSLDSIHTVLPMEYYGIGVFCEPEGKPVLSAENLGEYITGDRIENSPYQLFMKKDTSCNLLCRRTLSPKIQRRLSKMIKDEYRVNMIVDNLPSFTHQYYQTGDERSKEGIEVVDHFEKGHLLGFLDEVKKPFVFNHLAINILIHAVGEASYRIVGFEVEPKSVKHEFTGGSNGDALTATSCGGDNNLPAQPARSSDQGDIEFLWTYDVVWTLSDVKWASRWDVYLKMHDSEIHWFSILNSLMIVIFLSVIVAMIMIRTLHRDLMRYNQVDVNDEETLQEETGWKLVHGDVFRAPALPSLLATLVGTGAQVLGMALSTIIFAVIGLLSPSNRGALMSAVLLLFVFMGMFAGFTSTRLYSMFGLAQESWRRNTIATALLFPGINFGVFFALNLLVWSQGSSGAIPFFELFAILVLWFGVSVPLVYFGSYIASKRESIKHPVKVNFIERIIPEQNWYSGPMASILLGGILPFGAVFIEVFFIMSSLWLHRFYYVFGFLLMVFLILLVTCVEITIVLCYFHLCAEDYRWWWRSFFTSGSSAGYLLLYSVVYFSTRLNISDFVSVVLFFGYMSLISFFFFVLTGSVGFMSTLLFVRKIYGSVKVE